MTRKKSTSTRKKSTNSSSKPRPSRRRTTAKKRPTTRGGSSPKSTSQQRSSSTRRKAASRSKKNSPALQLNLHQKALIFGIGIIFITAVLVLSLLSPNQGQLTNALAGLMWRVFGWGGVVVPVMTGAFGLYLVMWGMEQPPALPAYRLVGTGLLFLTVEAFASMAQVLLENGYNDVWAVAQAERGGGYFGGTLAMVLMEAIGVTGAIFILMVLGLIAVLLASGVTRADMGNFVGGLLGRRPAPSSSVNRGVVVNRGRSSRGGQAVAEQPPLIPEDYDPVAAAAAAAAEAEAAAKASRAPEPKPTRRRKSNREAAPTAEEAPTIATPVFVGNMNPQPGTRSWTLPSLSEMLESGSDLDVNNTVIRGQVEIIEHTLESFGAPATVVEINQGPAITQFGVEPNFIEQRSGKRTKVKVGKIAGLSDDLALALAAQSIRIQAPVPGKKYVGIEVPNVTKALVSLRDVMESSEFKKIKSPLGIGLGQNVAGRPISADLAAMPHLLIAGTTGSGKSVCVNGIIACLLLQNTPDDLKIVMVDPKRVELTGYNGIPHLAAPVVVEMDRVIGTLQWAMREMENRYKLFAEIGARNITDYNKKVKKRPEFEKLCYIVIVIDELADLMMLSPEETERGVTRLAQMARATGIHMIIATQRPSVDVVTGLIKANFPARIAFAVASSTDSRVILDSTGAERLLGQGDMLFQSPDAAAPVRLQGCYVSDKELDDLIEYWKKARRFSMVSAQSSIIPRSQAGAAVNASSNSSSAGSAAESAAKPEQETTPTEVTQPSPRMQPLWEELQKVEEKSKYEDELMPEVIASVREMNKASTSLLQRRYRIGYTRAARLIDAMEEEGIIGPPTGTSKAREVLPWKDDEAGEIASEEEESEQEA